MTKHIITEIREIIPYWMIKKMRANKELKWFFEALVHQKIKGGEEFVDSVKKYISRPTTNNFNTIVKKIKRSKKYIVVIAFPIIRDVVFNKRGDIIQWLETKGYIEKYYIFDDLCDLESKIKVIENEYYQKTFAQKLQKRKRR